ncbi:probable L-gulonolactone oxidase 4 [Bradysia coprophila]|uniref:probable L-gulonolactone oxidase 4 n=1 Tax=Bradysia coprophila TaxID=38358 RepID=UPI00187DA67F|nr:probable L-gulonolactone oxidase 4 [Bradysia coprophila]
MSYFYYIFFYFLVSFEFVFSTTISVFPNLQCDIKCSKWELVCIKPPKSYSPKLPYVVCNPSDSPRYPESADDVEKIVKEAITKGVAVKAYGNQNGQSDLICTAGIPMAIGALQYKKMNDDNTVTFGAGVNLFDCGEFLRQNGRALATVPPYGSITLVGAVVTGEHGNSLNYDSTLAAQVVKMTIINSKGDIQVISSPDELKAFSLSLGLLGICVDITLRTVKLYKLQAHNYIEGDDILFNDKAIKWARNTDELTLFWFPSSEEVVVSNRTIVCDETPGNARSNDLLSSVYANFAKIFFKAKETAFKLTSNICAEANAGGYEILHAIENFMKFSLVQNAPEMVPIFTEDGINVVNPAVGYPHMISSPTCYSKPQGPNQAACPDSHGANSITTLDYEFSIKTCDLADFAEAVKDIIKKTPTAFPVLGIRITFSGRSDIFLSPSFGQESAYVEFRMLNTKDLFNQPSASLAGFQTIVQALIYKFNGRSNWGKGGLVVHSAESIKLKLEKLARDGFIDALQKHDPEGVFMNKVGLRLTGKSTDIDVNPLATRCALLGSCFCSKDTDCGPNQTCTTLPGYDSYHVCQTRNEQCSKPINPIPSLDDLVKYLDVDVAKLAEVALSKC